MKKGKQILALIGIILLVALYVLTLVMALVDPTSGMNYLFASIVATIIIPVLIWAYGLVYRLVKKDADPGRDIPTSSASEDTETPTR